MVTLTPDAIIEAMNKKDLRKVSECTASLVNERGAKFELSPFQHACCFARREFALALLKIGGDPHLRADGGGLSGLPLHLAVSGRSSTSQQEVDDRSAIAAALVAAGSAVDAEAVRLACELGAGKARKLAALLLERLPPSAIASGGGELLRAAVEYEHPEVVRAAIEGGIPVDDASERYPQGTTALHLAVKKRNADLVQLLVAAGARSDLKDRKGDTARSMATKPLLALLEGKAPLPAKKPTPAPSAEKQKEKQSWRDRLWKTPDDREALSVFADWLLENGEATRGEFVQLSLLPEPTEAQKKRAAQLRDKHRGAWLGPARAFVLSWEDSDESPGFVARATCSPEKLLEGFAAVVGLGPRLVVTPTRFKTRKLTSEVAELPLGKLWGLELRNPAASHAPTDWLDDTSMGLLVPALAGLRSLTLAPDRQLPKGFTGKSLELVGRTLGPTLEYLSLVLSPHWTEPPFVTSLVPTTFPRLVQLSITGASPAVQKALKAKWKGAAAKLVFLAE